jgi:hypothetical protein
MTDLHRGDASSWRSPSSPRARYSASAGRHTTNGTLFRGDLPALQDALKKGVLAFHRGRIRGAYPQILPGPSA